MNTRHFALCLLLTTPQAVASELEQLAWLAGHWVSPDGSAEEIWMEPRGGTMAGSFRWVFPDGRQVLEYLVIEETEGGVMFRFKHFNTDFEPWEKGQPNTYRLQSAGQRQAEFVLINDNPSAPQRYSYTRDGDRLDFRGETDGEEPLLLTFSLRE